ncbi:hypothetical protein LAZ67_8001272 [Cordylochernes scorpioides]|uniref:Uncharacterized protein n=1 Tax=Cordylochernes scorpioides TaxID=51811 RepID=A0ABY6KQK0_9ARAC|nr:hypothetical protein LAZ67_8001272 [Cordylochernes scorpioides]
MENIGVMDEGRAESKRETDQAVMDKFRTETKLLESSRYEVHLPWIDLAQKLKKYISHAEKRFRKATGTLKKIGKRTIRSIISVCAMCRCYNYKRVQTESIPIPATRIGSTPAFGVIDVDLAGPLTETS